MTASRAPAAPDGEPSPETRSLHVAIPAGAAFLVSLDATAALAAFPALRASFPDASPATLSWVLTGYSLVFAALLVPMGRWGDQVGWRRALLTGLTCFGVGATLGALSGNVVMLVLARGLQAAGAAMLTPAALALALAQAKPEQRPRLVGLWGAIGALAAAIGPGVGALLMETFSWRALFAGQIPGGVLLLALVWRQRTAVPSSAVRRGTVDLVGVVLLTVGMGLIAGAMGQVNRETGLSWATLSAVAFGLLVLGVFVWHAWDRPEAALDLSLFRDRTFRWANAGTLIFGTAFGLMFLNSVLFLTGVWNYSLPRAGLAAMVGPLAVVPFALWSGRVATRTGYRPLVAAGGVLFALSQFWYVLRLGAEASYVGQWLPGQLLTGASIGLVLPSLAGAAAQTLTRQRLAVGNAVNLALRQIGMGFGIALGISLVGQANAGMADFRVAFLTLALGGALTAVLASQLAPLRLRQHCEREAVATT